MTSGAATTAAVVPVRWRKERREIDSGCSIGFFDTIESLRKRGAGARLQYVARGGDVARPICRQGGQNDGTRILNGDVPSFRPRETD
jgi:hypothetical protein